MAKNQLSLAAGLLAVLLAGALPAQNLLLNGDFETNTAGGCAFNLTNSVFNATVSNCTAFSTTQGGAGEICVMVDSAGCGWGLPPASGLTKLGIATSGAGFLEVDQFSMNLSAPVVAGQSYTLKFQANAVVTTFSPQIANVEVGLSSSATSFGTLVFSGTPSSTSWSQFSHTFVAPAGASFVTVRQQAGPDSWNHVDAFSLEGAGCTAPTLTVAGATAGGTATATVDCATAGGLVVLGYSLTGGGPVNVNAGCAVVTVSMTPPITQVNLTANAAGTATFTTNVPPGTTGVNVWVQAFDAGSCSLTNGQQVTL